MKLDELLCSSKDASRDTFAAANPFPFLLCRLRAAPTNAEATSFHTQVITPANLSLSGLAKAGLLGIADIASLEVFPVAKTDRNFWRDRVSVGRARNNDIVLVEDTVSKSHAHFLLSGAQIRLQDAGSRNGTRLNEVDLIPGKPMPVNSGDEVSFGRLETVYLDAEALLDLMSNLVRAPA